MNPLVQSQLGLGSTRTQAPTSFPEFVDKTTPSDIPLLLVMALIIWIFSTLLTVAIMKNK